MRWDGRYKMRQRRGKYENLWICTSAEKKVERAQQISSAKETVAVKGNSDGKRAHEETSRAAEGKEKKGHGGNRETDHSEQQPKKTRNQENPIEGRTAKRENVCKGRNLVSVDEEYKQRNGKTWTKLEATEPVGKKNQEKKWKPPKPKAKYSEQWLPITYKHHLSWQ